MLDKFPGGEQRKATREKLQQQQEDADIAVYDYLIKNTKDSVVRKGYEAEKAKIIANQKNRKLN